jgi:hypothetical protein
MSVNSATIASLEAQPVPIDRECPRSLTDILKGVQDFVAVVGLASQVQIAPGVTTPVTNNLGAQALALANEVKASLDGIVGNFLNRRVVAVRQNIPAGDSVQNFTIDPAMPSVDYEVRLFFTGPGTHPGQYYGWRVVSGSQTTTSFQISFDNAHNNMVITVLVEDMKNVVV